MTEQQDPGEGVMLDKTYQCTGSTLDLDQLD